MTASLTVQALANAVGAVEAPHAMPLYSTADLRSIEQTGATTQPPHTLMSLAGAAVADWLYARLPALATAGRQPVLLLAGPGNNGGDAYIAARDLQRLGVAVEVWQLSPPVADDARWAHAEAGQAGVPIVTVPDTMALGWLDAKHYAWIVDGLFGIGLSRALTGVAADLVHAVNASRIPVLAIDIPSGLNARTGMALVDDDSGARTVIRADATLAMLGATPGLYTGIGRDVSGTVTVASLGVDSSLAARACRCALTIPSDFAADLPTRRHATHKGSYGSLAILGGHDGMIGAPLLSARSGLMSGAGRVYVGFVTHAHPAYDAGQPELMLRAAEDLDVGAMQAVAIGPGLGTDAASAACLARALSLDHTPLVLDADALNILAGDATLAERVRRRPGPTVLTPHPLEAARLAGSSIDHIQADRLGAARALATHFGATVVLKGSGTIVEDGERTWVNPTGNAGLATAGTGDVLTGLIGALLAQGMSATSAALAGVWLHGRAAERCVSESIGPAGLTASELLPAIRTELGIALSGAHQASGRARESGA